jgi:hypothetical protein
VTNSVSEKEQYSFKAILRIIKIGQQTDIHVLIRPLVCNKRILQVMMKTIKEAGGFGLALQRKMRGISTEIFFKTEMLIKLFEHKELHIWGWTFRLNLCDITYKTRRPIILLLLPVYFLPTSLSSRCLAMIGWIHTDSNVIS